MSEMRNAISQALARAYCAKINEKKVLDPDLLEVMAGEVLDILSQQLIEGNCVRCDTCKFKDVCPPQKQANNYKDYKVLPAKEEPKEIEELNLQNYLDMPSRGHQDIRSAIVDIIRVVNVSVRTINSMRKEK